MKELIIGTAGHVDHGKTALIEAMTGYNGDEMAEEKERGITIDLSFSNMRQKGEHGETNVAFIDVPGHERLIKNMISGAFGFDAALLVIDAREGIMPQTREHLAILRIVGVRQIVVALSKSDLVDEAAIAHQTQAVQSWFAQEYPEGELLGIHPTSIHRPDSIAALKDALFALPPRTSPDAPFFRYYIDRVFSPRGAGTVVTGTVLSGTVRTGDKLNVAELAKPTAVRGIQVHGQAVESAHTHQRVALNLTIPHTDLAKGYLLASKGYFRGFTTLSGRFDPLEGHRLPHGADVLFITGAKRVEGQALLDESGRYVTLKLRHKVFAQFGDPYILLLSGRVIGGGRILAPVHDPMRKRPLRQLLSALDANDMSRAFELILANHRHGFGLISSYQRFGLGHDEAIAIAEGLEGVLIDREGLVLYPPEAQEDLRSMITALYDKNPRALLSPSSITTRAKWAGEWLAGKVMSHLADEGYLRQEGSLYVRADQDFAQLDLALESEVYAILESEGLTPEAPYNLYDRLDLDRKRGDDVLKRLTAARKVIRLAHNLFVTESNLKRALAQMRELIVADGYLDVQSYKAHTGMSRKYCIAYLEYLDKSGDVVNEKGKRVLKYQ